MKKNLMEMLNDVSCKLELQERNAWLGFRVASLAYVFLSEIFMPSGRDASCEALKNSPGVLPFSLVSQNIGISIVVGIVAGGIVSLLMFALLSVHPAAKNLWTKPKWTLCPFCVYRNEPVLFLHFVSFLAMTVGLGNWISTLMTEPCVRDLGPFTLSLGVGIYLITKASPFIFRRKFAPAA